MTDHPFQKDDKIVCIDANSSYEKLTVGEVYTVSETRPANIGHGTLVVLDEVPGTAYQDDRFKKAEPKVVVQHQFAGADPAVFMDTEGVKVYSAAEANRIQIGVEMPQPEIKPGDWVAVQGQVLESTENSDPGDHLVEFFSHNEQWKGWVRKDRVSLIPTPGHVEQCPAMTVNVMDTNVWYRCEKPDHRRFDRHHKSGKFEWLEGDTSGYIEEA